MRTPTTAFWTEDQSGPPIVSYNRVIEHYKLMETSMSINDTHIIGSARPPAQAAKDGEGLMLGGVMLKEKIGEGGMGTVYRGMHTRLNFPVAVKILKEASVENLSLFLREARLTVSIDHPNLVRVLDVNCDTASQMHYIIMEYIEGYSAYQYLWQHMKDHNAPLSEVEALGIIIKCASALGAAHRAGVVHRDVKSENILIRKSDKAVKVTDLGFAGHYTHTSAPAQHVSLSEFAGASEVVSTPLQKGGRLQPAHSSLAGTIGFLSPEALAGARSAPTVDVYALGVTLYEFLTGDLPYGAPFDHTYYERQFSPAPDPRTRRPDLSEEVALFVLKCINNNPAERFANGDEMAAAAQGVLAAISGPLKGSGLHAATYAAEAPIVLCVDDDAGVLALMEQILLDGGFRPVCFTDGIKALQQIQKIKPEVAVVDLIMPRINGMELCKQLRAAPGFEELAVLILSGTGSSDAINLAMEYGITDYLVKPMSASDLLVRVRLLSKLRKMSSERTMIESQLSQMKNRQRSTTAITQRHGETVVA